MNAAARTYLLTTIVCLALIGCATGRWVTLKNGHPTDVSEARIDSLACEREAATTYPFAQVITSQAGNSGSSSTTCSGSGGTINCDTYRYGSSGPTVTTTDGNAVSRANYYQSCMKALGYQRVFVRDSGATSSRRDLGGDSEPLTSFRDEKYVVEAGGYCNESSDCVVGLACQSHKCVR
jgi:hypothetical protein